MPEVRKLYDEIHNNPMKKASEDFIKDLQKILQGEEIKADKLLERSIDNKESKISQFIEKKKQVSDLLKAKMKVRVKQEFFTPMEFVDDLIDLSGFEFVNKNKIYNILEPSAGWGNIVKGLLQVIQRKKLNVDIDIVEIQPDNRKELQKLSDIIPHMIHLQKEPDFLQFLSSKKYDFVFMNPPFHLQASQNKEYTTDVYSYHFVMRAYAMLNNGGILVAITGREWQKDKVAKAFYKKVKAKTINKTVKWGGEGLKKGAEVSKLDITFIKIVKNDDNPKLDNDLLILTDKLVKQPQKEKPKKFKNAVEEFKNIKQKDSKEIENDENKKEQFITDFSKHLNSIKNFEIPTFKELKKNMDLDTTKQQLRDKIKKYAEDINNLQQDFTKKRTLSQKEISELYKNNGTFRNLTDNFNKTVKKKMTAIKDRIKRINASKISESQMPILL